MSRQPWRIALVAAVLLATSSLSTAACTRKTHQVQTPATIVADATSFAARR